MKVDGKHGNTRQLLLICPADEYLQLIHKADPSEQDGTLWSIYEVSSSVLSKRNIIPIPNKPGKYFLNEMVMI
jgi:hypothetical protein